MRQGVRCLKSVCGSVCASSLSQFETQVSHTLTCCRRPLNADISLAHTNLWDNRSAPESALVSALTNALGRKGLNAGHAKLRKPVGRIKATATIPSGAEGSLEAELVRG